MQWDRTRLAVRERGFAELLDLALHFARGYRWPLAGLLAASAIPLALLNEALLHPMLPQEWDLEWPLRYVWNMTLLVFIEAPLATAPLAAFLGQAVFHDRPRPWEAWLETWRRLTPLAWCHLVLRLIAPVLLVYSLLFRQDFVPLVEVLLLPALALTAGIVRLVRPFVNEIVLLEKPPLRSPEPRGATFGRRSAYLHGAALGDNLLRGFVTGLLCAALAAAVYCGVFWLSAIILGQAWHTQWLVRVGWPATLWLLAGGFAVVRFLSYLDARIRQEGWEVELRMRAEAARLAEKLT